MELTKHFEGWRAKAGEVRTIIDLFCQADEEAPRAGVGVLSVETQTGSDWQFDDLSDFLDEIGTDTFRSYQFSTRSTAPAALTGAFLSSTIVQVTLPTREQMQLFLDEVERLCPVL